MHVHIHKLRHTGDMQNHGGMPPLFQNVTVGGAHQAGKLPVGHRPSVDEEILLIGLAPREGGQAAPAAHGIALPFRRKGKGIVQKGAPENGGNARLFRPRRKGKDRLCFCYEAKGHIRMRQRQPPQHPRRLHGFRPRRAQELQPRRRGKKQIPHAHRGAGCPRRRPRLLLASRLHPDLPGRIRLPPPRDDGKPRHRGNGRKRLAAKA